ncbi:Hypothetical predicted protein [Olea europaea subsp. europaea]|uniref:Uncharacterized protein n=1 Tax=Olea europaea subsp. europaea TaxID=158383 RepID=A0A8S0TMM6_OLEEU|nr:Hypothetical predicted protein [Olea europaea subsp. europaea]
MARSENKHRPKLPVLSLVGIYNRWQGPYDYPSSRAVLHVAKFKPAFDTKEALLPDHKAVEKLRRFRYRSKYNLASFGPALTFYVDCLKACGQTDASKALHLALLRISNEAAVVDEKFRASAVRSMLKQFDSHVEKLNDNFDPRWTMRILLAGPRTLGGPAPYTQKMILDMATEWTQGSTVWGENVKEFVVQRTRHYAERWCAQKNYISLTFEQFVTDVARWATPGGAPAVTINEEKIRSKWAFGAAHAIAGGMLKIARSKDPRCVVVPKEEPAKTRLIITTPMASYLNQAYIWYRMGKPRMLKSTIGGFKTMQKWQENNYPLLPC